jgi:hypothetical protein
MPSWAGQLERWSAREIVLELGQARQAVVEQHTFGLAYVVNGSLTQAVGER